MKTSARNSLTGVIAQVVAGAVNAEVVLTLADGFDIVSVVTLDAVRDLDLKPGRTATALIKASFVILAPGAEPLRTSARNCLAGTIVHHVTGAVNDEVTLELQGGHRITATITRESAEDLGFAVGAPAQALIKAPHVILAVD